MSFCCTFRIVVLPAPWQVAVAMATNSKILLDEAWVTLLECVYGFALAMGIGIPIAVVMTYSRIANLMFYPLLVASQSIPKVAVAPILLVWFGTGIESKLAMAFVIAFFPGRRRHRDRTAIDLARAPGARTVAAMLAAADLLQDPAAVGAAVDLLRRQDRGHAGGHRRRDRRVHRLERRPRQPAADRQLPAQLRAGLGVARRAERAWGCCSTAPSCWRKRS